MFNKSRIIVLSAVTVALAATTAITAPSAQAYPGVWDRLAMCESSGNWAINSGNTFYGGLQFTKSTWLAFGGGAYAPYAHMATKAQQVAIAQKTLIGQGPGAWPVCSIKAGLTRANGAGVITVSRKVTRASLKLDVDGILGPLTKAAMARKSISFNTTAAVKAWQARLRVTKDGIVGPVTTKAIQRWLNTH